MKKTRLFSAFAALLLAVCPTLQAQDLENISVDGNNRSMLVYAPKDLAYNPPLVISLHGANQDAAYQRDQTHWNNCADTAKFVVVYPNAINKFWDVNGTSDIRFIEVVIEKMYERYHINRNRIYITGFSLGAMMTYHCMDHLGNKVAAFGPVSGVRFDNKAPKSPRRVPFIHTHGTADDVFKWTGDPNHAAGGYPAIPEYVQKWATYEGLTVKTVIKPYPASKKTSQASLTTWTQPGDSIEIALLAIDGKGHWHSEDIAGSVSTTQEIWKFCSRYSLGPAEPEPPVVKRVEPEDLSFDLLTSQRSFFFEFDKAVDVSSAQATLEAEGVSLPLSVQASADAASLTFTVADDADIQPGDYKLKLTGIKNAKGGQALSYTYTYTYGITEVGDAIRIDTLLCPDWGSMQASVGEGIPYGWKRVNSNDDGTNDTKTSGTPNSAGARLKYFSVGGDFSTGFYLSARDYQLCTLTYGLYDGYRLSLPVGKYELKFRSTYWSEGAWTAGATFGMNVAPLGTGTQPILKADDLKPTGCVKERTDVAVENTMLHDYAFTVDKTGLYTLNFTMSQGWSSIILADVLLTTYPSAADIYKGGFLRLMKQARAVYDATASQTAPDVVAHRDALKACIDQYEGFASTAPSAYTAAIQALEQALLPLQDFVTGIVSSWVDAQPSAIHYYTPDGVRHASPQHGLNIVRKVYADGTSQTLKLNIQ